jgi:ribonuclease PH
MTIRRDTRAVDELRSISFQRGFTRHAAGSVLVGFGDTRVICTAMFEDKVPGWLKGSGRGWVTAEYAMLPSSTATRSGREKNARGRAQEISRLIGRSLRAATDLSGMGECQISIDCDVIQADGGTRTAAITGAWLALYDALNTSVKAGHLPAMPLKGGCAAVSVGLVDGVPLLDLDYSEDVRAEVDLNIVMDDQGRFIEVQGCAEGAAFDRSALDQLLDLASGGVRSLILLQQEALAHG